MNRLIVQTSPRASNASNQTRQCHNTSVNGVKGEAEIRDQLTDRKNIDMFILWLEQRYRSDDTALGSPILPTYDELVIQSGVG